jgi:hypothetical protein
MIRSWPVVIEHSHRRRACVANKPIMTNPAFIAASSSIDEEHFAIPRTSWIGKCRNDFSLQPTGIPHPV